MPLIAQICIVLVTIALVGVAAFAIRLMVHLFTLIENANRSLAAFPTLIEEARRTSARADELLIAFSKITHSAQTGVSRLEGLAERSSTLASTLLDEIERPVARTVGVIRGIRMGARQLMQRWASRAGTRSRARGAEDVAGVQEWLDDGGSTVPRQAVRTGSEPASNGR